MFFQLEKISLFAMSTLLSSVIISGLPQEKTKITEMNLDDFQANLQLKAI